MTDVLVRGRIMERLVRASSFPITLMRGAAGSGKSLALRSFLETQSDPCVRFDVTPEHQTFARFVRGLADALAPAAPGARLSFASAYERAMQSKHPDHDLSTWFNEHVKLCTITIAMDNLHNADGDPYTQTFLSRLIELTCGHIRWLIASRSADYFPLPGWMAFHRMDVPIEEAELAFTQHEVEQLAHTLGRTLPDEESRTIMDRTGGWPTGVAFLLRSADSEAESTGPIRAYEPLIQTILDGCDTWTVRALMSMSFLPDVSPGILCEQGNESTAQTIGKLLARAPFLFVQSGDVIRYHDLFSKTLQSRLAAEPRGKLAAVEIAAGILRRNNRFLDTLLVYMHAGVYEPAITILAYHGLTLIEQGHADVVETCLARLKNARQLPASVVALRAIIQSRRGRYDTAEAWFNEAILNAGQDDAQIIEIKYLYACDLMRRDRLDCIPLLQAHANDENLPLGLRAGILSALAQARMLAEEPAAANIEIARALELTETLFDDALRARVLARAAYVFLYQLDYESASRYASQAAALAEQESMFYVATGAYSVLYVCAFDAEEPVQALRYLDKLLDNGLKSGNLQFHYYYLACAFEIEVERHNLPALARIDEALRSFDVEFATSTSDEAFLPGYALRATWNGNFDRAYKLLAPTAEHQATAERRSLRWSEVAVYAAGAGLVKEATHAVENGLHALQACTTTNRTLRAKILLALALCTTGDLQRASDLLARLENETAMPKRLAALAQTVALLRDRIGGLENHRELSAAIDALQGNDCGGFARLIVALPAVRSAAPPHSNGAARRVDTIERTLISSRAEIAVRALERSTLPAERTIAMNLLIDQLLDKILEQGTSHHPTDLAAWLEATYDNYGTLACLSPVLAATWHQVLAVGAEQNRRSNGNGFARIGAIIDAAVRKPRIPASLGNREGLDEVDVAIGDLIARLFEKDVITAEHSRAVSSWCARLARKLGFSAAETTLVQRGGLLHDIGKLATPDEILNAPRGLTPEEWDVMQRHTTEGAHLISDIPPLAAFVPAIRSHHERIDGHGYPEGLRTSAIPLSARIVSVADCFNAMIGRRPYRPPMMPFRALDELTRSAGRQLDPEIVDAMIAIVAGT